MQKMMTFTDFGNDDWFLKYLDGVEVPSRLLTTHDHLAESTLPEHFEKFKVFQRLNNNN